MPTPLLTTKLYVPPSRPGLVPRPRLIERLDEGLRQGRKLTLLSAPAGFGKTTLLSEWVADCGSPVAWLALDEGDNDPVRFWAYFVAALQTVEAAVEEEMLGPFQSSQPPMEAILTAIINRVATLPGPLALILDDYHLIAAQAIHDGLAFLLEHLPPNLRLVISTRADPPLPLARLRARGQMVEIRTDDLRFTPREATAFLQQAMGLNLSAEAVAALEARTEGWIAGLQMAALSLQSQDDASSLARAFSGTHHFVLDYLVDEVLNHQPQAVRTFLLRTSILEQMSDPLCDAVCAVEADVNGQTTLETLQRANLFVTPLDAERRWYRYHHLFAQLLRHRLNQQVGSRQVASLHRRAADWYEDNGMFADAIHHALAGEDFERAARLIEANVDASLQRNQIATLQRWLDALPPELARARPYLCTARAWVLIANARFDEAGRWASKAESALGIGGERAQRSPSAAGEKRTTGHIYAIQATVANSLGDDARTIALARRALENLPAADVILRGILALDLGEAFVRRDDLDGAERTFSEAIAVNREAGNVAVTLNLMSCLGTLYERRGNLDRAAAAYRQAIQLGEEASRPGGHPVPATGVSHVLLAHLLYERNDLQAALRHAKAGIACCKRWGHLENLVDGYDALAQTQFAQGDVAQAHDTVTQTLALVRDALALAKRTAPPARVERLSGETHRLQALRAFFWLMEGKLDAVELWLQERDASGDAPPCYTLLPRFYLARNEPDEALSLANESLREARESAPAWQRILLLALRACALHIQGDGALAMAALELALRLGEQGGYVRTFVEIGAPMQELLRQAAARGIAPTYVGQLLAAFAAPAPPQPAPLVEPPSPRELEVLRLIAADLSNQEIADTLFISRNTVKTHVRRLYAKLHVHSRLQAVERARELDLL